MHLHPPGTWSYELLLSRSRKTGSWKEQGNGRGLLLLTPGMPACCASLRAESVHRDAVCRDAIDRDAVHRDAVHRDAVSPHPYTAGVSALPPPVHLVGQPCQSAQQHMLYQVSTWHNLSFSRASGKAGDRQWLFPLLCWVSQHIPQAQALDYGSTRYQRTQIKSKQENWNFDWIILKGETCRFFSVLLINSDNKSNNFKTAFHLGSLEVVWKKVPGEVKLH